MAPDQITLTKLPQVAVEVIQIPSRRDKRMAFLAESSRQANEIQKQRAERTRRNKEKYARAKL